MKTYTMNNGLTIPAVGFGTYQAKDGDEVYNAVRIALEAGYRHIDTATLYRNEESIGRAIKDSGIPREELFIITKLWNYAHGYEEAKAAFPESLEKLGLDYVDLYLIHLLQGKRDRFRGMESIGTRRIVYSSNHAGYR